MSWSAKQYTVFEDERTRPVRDLLAALPDLRVRQAIDLGCGPGNSAAVLLQRFPDAQVSGIDSSEEMLLAARARLPQLRFALQDITSWSRLATARGDAGSFDVILANAVLQWLPAHDTLLPALLHSLARGGALAVQMPDNLGEPAHRLMLQTAAAGPWADKLTNAAKARPPLRDADWYYSTLHAASSRVDIWRTTYYHSLRGGAAAVVEWFKGSGLRPFLQPLDDAERAGFLASYTAAVAQAYPLLSDGSVLLPFPRLFMLAIR